MSDNTPSTTKQGYPRWAWALTGSGHFFTESIALIKALPAGDLFVS